MSQNYKFAVKEPIFESSQTLILYLESDEKDPLIAKVAVQQPPDEFTVESYKRDFQFSKTLFGHYPESFVDSLDLVEENNMVMIVQKNEDDSFTEFLKKTGALDLERFLELAIHMCKALENLHSLNVIHRDIKVGNFVLNKKTKLPKLIDFGISTFVSRKSPSITCTKPIGTFVYMSPEQTGRINQNVDKRSDIYSLGISFYEMLTGKLPFVGDKLEIVHAHMTKKLPRITALPKAINDILQKMCEKNAGERYSTALGVKNDLEYCLKNLKHIPEDFKPGKYDLKGFQIPNQIYGRNDEISLLQKIINEEKDQKTTKMCLVSGYSGSGKSKLIEEFSKKSKSELLVAHGKYDQFDKSTPYSAFIQILKFLILKISLDRENSSKIIFKMKNELKESGSVLKQLVPEIEILVGPQPDVVQLDKIEETQKRLFDSFLNFFNCFTDENRLILVVDDLQWCDSASFQLLNTILEDQKIFIIGAYRDNEVDQSHPLMLLLKGFQDIQDIHLKPLNLEHLNELVSDTLMIEKDITIELSKSIHNKTGGNPFFSKEFIITLYEEELLFFKNDKWNWDLQNVEKKNFSSNIIDFMIKNLKKGSDSMQKILKYASCIGNTFNLEQLLWIWDENVDLMSILVEPLQNGWIIQNNSNEFKFLHDRLQQASYELISKKEREGIHLIIGKTLLKEFKQNNLVKENIFQIVNHLNNSNCYEDKIELLRLNLVAAERSLQNSAYKLALEYAQIAVKLLSNNSWEEHYDDAFNTHQLLARAYYGNSLLKDSEKEYDILLQKAKKRVQKLTVYSEYIRMVSLFVQYDKGFLLLLDAFQMFDFTKDISKDDIPGLATFSTELKKKVTQETEKIGGFKNILQLKKCENEEIEILQSILAESIDILFLSPLSHPLMKVIGPLLSLHLFLLHGLTANSITSLAVAAWIFGFFFNEPDSYELAKAAEKLYSKTLNSDTGCNMAIVQFALGLSQQYGGTLKQMLYFLDAGSSYAISNNEYVFGSYDMSVWGFGILMNGQHYPKHISKMKNHQKWLLKKKNYFGHATVELNRSFMEDLMGIKDYDPKYNENILNFEQLVFNRVLAPLMRAMLHYFYYEQSKTIEELENVEEYFQEASGMPCSYGIFLYYSLALIHRYKQTKDKKSLEKVKDFIETFRKLANVYDIFFTPRLGLLETVLQAAISESNKYEILSSFENVIESSQQRGFYLITAIALESTLEFCIERNFPDGTSVHYYHNLISMWGTIGGKKKIQKIKAKYAQYSRKLSSSSLSNVPTSGSMTTLSSNATHSDNSSSNDSLDMLSIIKTSQALSSEIKTSNLIKKVMQILIENMGAENAILVMIEDEDFIKAKADSSNVMLMNKLGKDHPEMYCSGLFELVKVSKKSLFVSNASKSEYASSSYIANNNVKSLIISPIIKGNKLMGIIQLENNSIEGAFTENRKNTLAHISSQLAISYENSNFYENINSLNESYERFLPKEFLNQLGKNDIRKVKKGDSTTKDISVLFSDIRSFTDITENMNSEESFSFVNGILQYLAPVISRNNGFIDKFFGDCIMALFPYSVDDSVKCGLELLQALEQYNKECRIGMNPVKIGIGIHYGDVMIGTIGAEERIDATVISDTVNTASRVESFTKTLKSTFVVTESIIKNVKDSTIYPNRYIGKYLFKGKQNPIGLYHIIQKKENVKEFTEGMKLFEAKKFNQAKKIFEEINDSTCGYLQNVCVLYENYLFEDSWNGEIKIDKDGIPIILNNETNAQRVIENLDENQQKDISNELLNAGLLKDFLTSVSHHNPEMLNQLLEKFK